MFRDMTGKGSGMLASARARMMGMSNREDPGQTGKGSGARFAPSMVTGGVKPPRALGLTEHQPMKALGGQFKGSDPVRGTATLKMGGKCRSCA